MRSAQWGGGRALSRLVDLWRGQRLREGCKAGGGTPCPQIFPTSRGEWGREAECGSLRHLEVLGIRPSPRKAGGWCRPADAVVSFGWKVGDPWVMPWNLPPHHPESSRGDFRVSVAGTHPVDRTLGRRSSLRSDSRRRNRLGEGRESGLLTDQAEEDAGEPADAPVVGALSSPSEPTSGVGRGAPGSGLERFSEKFAAGRPWRLFQVRHSGRSGSEPEKDEVKIEARGGRRSQSSRESGDRSRSRGDLVVTWGGEALRRGPRNHPA